MNWGEEAQARLSRVAACSTTIDGVSRLPFSGEHAAALDHIRGWMERAGLEPEMTASGTLVGRSASGEEGPTLILGSHQDSVPHGGRYDGIMGVLLPCLALEKMRRDGRRPTVPVEVVAFADEEGVRFPTALIGPRALAGTLDPAALDLMDADGISIARAMADFGGAPDQLSTLRRRPEDVLGFVEVHIEQGPVLENAELALGTVTGICGIERNAIVFTGETGHAGTMPMAGRKDALVAAAHFISGVNALAQEQGDVRATVGTLSLAPGAVNAIPKRVELVLELRAIDDAQRQSMHDAARALAAQSAAAMGCGISFERTYSQDAVLCEPGLQARVADAVTATQGGTGFDLPSGATHDASAMSDLCPVAMMFVRCRGGVSHRPDEYVTDADMALAIDALDHLLAGF